MIEQDGFVICLDNYAKKTTTVAELKVYNRYEGKKEEQS